MPPDARALSAAKMGLKPVPVPETIHYGESCLKTVAQIASLKQKATVVLNAQSDSALMWKAASIHPMQALENVHQRAVRAAVRALEENGVTDEAQLKAAEVDATAEYFLLNVGSPTRLGPVDKTNLFPDEQVAEAQKKLKAIYAAIGATANEAQVPSFKAAVSPMLKTGTAVIKSFNNPKEVVNKAPALDKAQAAIVSLGDALNKARTLAEVKKLVKDIGTNVFGELEKALAGVASVQMFHIVDSFYLFRLLVSYRIESTTEVSDDLRRGVSSELTGRLNNEAGREWMKVWLCDKLRNLDGELSKLDSQNLIFFVKGGRALKYIEGTPESGKNDWDTSIVINPNLPPKDWYALFVKVHNLVLEKLKEYKRELYVEFHREGKAFAKVLDTELTAARQPPAPAQQPAPVVAPPVDPANDPANAPNAQALIIDTIEIKQYSASCKAELIDIGIPRYDTEEALEQWRTLAVRKYVDRRNVQDANVAFNGVPFPLHDYYIAEYNIMVREAFAGLSHSLDKTPTRVDRLNGVLKLASVPLDNLFAEYRKTAGHLPKSLAAIDAMDATKGSTSPMSKSALRILVYFLHQCWESYDLRYDDGLAGAFDTFFAANCTKAKITESVTIPAAFQRGIDAWVTDGKWKTEHQDLTLAIGFGQWISNKMSAHLADRQTFLLKAEWELKTFVDKLEATLPFSKHEEWEVQVAVSGAYAANLHASYQEFNRDTALAPLDRFEIGMYAQNDQAKRSEVTALFKPNIDEVMKGEPYKTNIEFVVQDDEQTTNGVMLLRWKTNVTIGEFSYKPTVFKFAVQVGKSKWPRLAFIWGLPVLSLRDLVFEYRHKCAETEEFGTRLMLRKATAAISEMLTNYENPA